jgi:ferredoxin-NADP reductase
MHKYTVVSNESLTPTTSLLTLKKDSIKHPFSFEPGQYAAISFYNHSRPTAARCFSIVSSPTEANVLPFSMRKSGRLTKAISDVEPGQTVNVRGPFGGFVFDWENDKNAVLLAGGIGITPFMSILRFATKIESANKINLIYSCRTQDDIPFLEELKNLELKNQNLTIFYVIGSGLTDKLDGLKGALGFVTPEIIDMVTRARLEDKTFYICGPPPFMNGMIKTLHSKQVPESRIITEAFGQGSHKQTGKIKSWPFNIYMLGAVSLALGSFMVMLLDLLKTIPPASIIEATKPIKVASPANARQADLDKLVNGLASAVSAGAPSDAVIAAQKAATPVATATPTSGPTATSTSRTTTSTTPSVSAPAPVATPTPTPVHVPVCTTSPSGVKTCV